MRHHINVLLPYVAVVGCSWSVFVSSQYLKWSEGKKKQWQTSNRVMGSQGSLVHMESKGWAAWFNPTDELL